MLFGELLISKINIPRKHIASFHIPSFAKAVRYFKQLIYRANVSLTGNDEKTATSIEVIAVATKTTSDGYG